MIDTGEDQTETRFSIFSEKNPVLPEKFQPIGSNSQPIFFNIGGDPVGIGAPGTLFETHLSSIPLLKENFDPKPGNPFPGIQVIPSVHCCDCRGQRDVHEAVAVPVELVLEGRTMEQQRSAQFIVDLQSAIGIGL